MLRDVERYYSAKIRTHGPTPAGVDWNSTQSQQLRFDKLLTVCDRSRPFSLLDYGCGYGALVDSLEQLGCEFDYWGIDVSPAMIAEATERHAARANCHFVVAPEQLPVCDYVVASGTFNVKVDAAIDAWHEHVLATLRQMFALASKGMAFNLLTAYADRDRMRADLYYADPCALFHFCKTELSRYVALIHDYELYEFTMLIRR